MSDKRQKIIIITGPTATGKSSLAVDFASKLDGEIVNCDSMQVYRCMDIGTAKPSPEEQGGIKHHLLDVVNPDEEFNASTYREHAVPVIEDIIKRNKACFVVGGTGLYIKSLLGGLLKCPPANREIRDRLNLEYDEKGGIILRDRLKKADPQAADKIHPNDKMRITRALEIIELTGRPFSELASRHSFANKRYDSLKICLFHEREKLYERINRRSIEMLESGLIEETEKLLRNGYSSELKPLKSIGYRHAVEYIQKKRGFDRTVELLQRDTRRYAKRQITWFKADPEMFWVSSDNISDAEKKIKKFI